jgi:hypothetical protein
MDLHLARAHHELITIKPDEELEIIVPDKTDDIATEHNTEEEIEDVNHIEDALEIQPVDHYATQGGHNLPILRTILSQPYKRTEVLNKPLKVIQWAIPLQTQVSEPVTSCTAIGSSPSSSTSATTSTSTEALSASSSVPSSTTQRHCQPHLQYHHLQHRGTVSLIFSTIIYNTEALSASPSLPSSTTQRHCQPHLHYRHLHQLQLLQVQRQRLHQPPTQIGPQELIFFLKLVIDQN